MSRRICTMLHAMVLAVDVSNRGLICHVDVSNRDLIYMHAASMFQNLPSPKCHLTINHSVWSVSTYVLCYCGRKEISLDRTHWRRNYQSIRHKIEIEKKIRIEWKFPSGNFRLFFFFAERKILLCTLVAVNKFKKCILICYMKTHIILVCIIYKSLIRSKFCLVANTVQRLFTPSCSHDHNYTQWQTS